MRFEKPVRVAVTALGNVAKSVETPESAADVLLNHWHGPMGAKHLAARRAVLKALEKAHDPVLAERARKAFEAAASDGGLLMNEPPKSDVPPGFKSPSWRRKKRVS